MPAVTTSVSYEEVEGDYRPVDGVRVTCDKCGHVEESGGEHAGSLKRCAALLNENCPRNEDNYYLVDGA